MSLDSKMTVSFFINTSLKPKLVIMNGRKVKTYPLYMMVIFASQNTKFKALIDGETIYMSKDQDPINDPIFGEKISQYIKKISEIIGSEIIVRKDRFSLTGLGKRIQIYDLLVSKIIGQISISDIYNHPSIQKGFDLKSILEYFLPKYRGVNTFDWLYEYHYAKKRRKPLPEGNLFTDLLGFESLLRDKIEGMLYG